MLRLLLLSVFCIYACYTDIRYQKIKNLTSFGLIYAGILLIGINLIQGSQSWTNAILCIVVALVTGVGFYMIGGVGAGDAKFYTGLAFVISALVPSEAIRTDQLIPVVLLINTLVVYVLFTILLTIVMIPLSFHYMKAGFNRISGWWQSVKRHKPHALAPKILDWISGILFFGAVLYTINWSLMALGYADTLLTFFLAILILRYLNALWERWHLGSVWKLSLAILWLMHLSLNVREVSLTFKDVFKFVVIITVITSAYRLTELVLATLSEKALSKFRYPIPSDSSVHIRFAPFLSMGSLLTILAKGGLYKLFIP